MNFSKLRVFAAQALIFGISTASAQTEQSKIDAARALWRSYNFPNYLFNFNAQCATCYIGEYPWLVQVSSGVPAKGVTTKEKPAVGALNFEQIFDEIQRVITSTTDSAFATYDEVYGYPTRYELQYGSSSSNKFVYLISGFIVEAGSPSQQYAQNRQIWNSQRITDYDFTYTDLTPSVAGVTWPLTVKVRNKLPVETKDNNGNIVTYLIPPTLDQYFDTIKRQLDSNAPFVENDYAKRGYMTNMRMVTNAVGSIKIDILAFSDTNLE